MMSKDIVLSNRLMAVTAMVSKGYRVCDVGCDHGFVSIYLVMKGITDRVIAMDVNKGPLMAAREHIDTYGLSDYIETRLSDGVTALDAKEADTLICAGMGGRLIRQILEAGSDKIRFMKEMILQPQSEIQSVREYLREKGYLISDENMIFEDGKYYPIIKVCLSVKESKVDDDVNYTDQTEILHPDNWHHIEDKYGQIGRASCRERV